MTSREELLFILKEVEKYNHMEKGTLALCLTESGDINLRHKGLRTLPESFGRIRTRHCIILSENKLETLPDSFMNMTVQNFDLKYNSLTELPKSFSQITVRGNLMLEGNYDMSEDSVRSLSLTQDNVQGALTLTCKLRHLQFGKSPIPDMKRPHKKKIGKIPVSPVLRVAIIKPPRRRMALPRGEVSERPAKTQQRVVMAMRDALWFA
jgi:hypothetical protein